VSTVGKISASSEVAVIIDPKHDVISRYEAKYLIDERTARAIAKNIRGYCSPDEHVDANGRYIVNNLYLETSELRFYYDTKFKEFNRFKPRVRFYGMEPESYLWVELKHKIKNVTWKTRRRIGVSEWPGLLQMSESFEGPARKVQLTDSFEGVVMRFQARPMLHVRYVREPYVSNFENYGRVTFDRCLTFRLAHGSYDLSSDCEMCCYDDSETTMYSDESPVILEIKTETLVPKWVVQLIQRFDLTQRGFSKYCYAIDNTLLAATSGDRQSAFL
jgi:hypothetical protein